MYRRQPYIVSILYFVRILWYRIVGMMMNVYWRLEYGWAASMGVWLFNYMDKYLSLLLEHWWIFQIFIHHIFGLIIKFSGWWLNDQCIQRSLFPSDRRTLQINHRHIHYVCWWQFVTCCTVIEILFVCNVTSCFSGLFLFSV